MRGGSGGLGGSKYRGYQVNGLPGAQEIRGMTGMNDKLSQCGAKWDRDGAKRSKDCAKLREDDPKLNQDATKLNQERPR